MKKLFAVLALAALTAACSSPTAPKTNGVRASNGHVSNSRYILISGATPRPGCYDGGDGYQYCN